MSKLNISEASRAPTRSHAPAVSNALWATYLKASHRDADADAQLQSDKTTKALLTAPVARADAIAGTSTTVGWGNELVGTAVQDYLSALAPLSAASRLFAEGARFDLSRRESVSFPIATNVGAPSWVAEDDEIPVVNSAFASADLGPTRQLTFILPLTRELWRRSNGRAVFDALARETVAEMLDAAVFSDTPASAAAHRGLRDGVAATPATGLVDADIAALMQAVVAAGGGGKTAIIMNPREHAVALLRFPQSPVPFWATRGLPEGTAIAIDLASFASGLGELEIMRSESAIVHMSDAPLPIVSGAPATADPVRSAFQTASIFIRVILDVAWVSRGDRVAVMEGVSW